MKRINRHGLIALIVSSLALLIVFQGFWIKKVYDEQYMTLKKDLDHTFRSTVMAMQDSMIQCSFGDLPKLQGDSLPFGKRERDAEFPPQFTRSDNFKTFEIHERKSPNDQKSDTSRQNRISFTQKDGVKITIASDSLSGRDIARIVTRAYFNKPVSDSTGKNQITSVYLKQGDSVRLSVLKQKATDAKHHFTFTDTNLRQKTYAASQINIRKRVNAKDTSIFINLNLDSLRLDDIAVHYWLALMNQRIDIPFKIRRLHQSQVPSFSPYNRENAFDKKEDTLKTNPVFAGMPKFNVYVAQFPEYQAFLFKKTLPQIFFSMLLLGITTLAFWLVYRSLRQQERLTDLKNDFISNITHELKTPIATVSVAIEALQNFNALQKPELTKEYLDISKNELSRLSMLVDKVLKLSVFEQKEPELNKEIIDVAAIVAQVLDSMRLQFEKIGTKISFHTAGSENTFVEADKTHLTSVIYNLLDNALKYNGKNIRINFQERPDTLQLNIEDDGCGIAAEYQGKIFDKFFRVPTGDIHNVKGYGLGLSYVASVMRQHGGRIEVQSVLEKGSIFSVFLPKR